ncbi:hypothetical protein BOTCAL_0755g00020 [Botryotinia calthae]|uniref:Uncharacterized protein n=1 Tax=Botryotinia calthae TaxID=38488 RepID=A0A4Y8CGH2_9HELO|nr:hypothetical protein BOTCAL_0755g00020 [Botryotinia calthae]
MVRASKARVDIMPGPGKAACALFCLLLAAVLEMQPCQLQLSPPTLLPDNSAISQNRVPNPQQ